MSTKAIREVIEQALLRGRLHAVEALREVEAIEKAAKDMTRLGGGDFTYNIRGRESVMRWADERGRNSWEAPDVKAWSDASMLLATIAKDAK